MVKNNSKLKPYTDMLSVHKQVGNKLQPSLLELKYCKAKARGVTLYYHLPPPPHLSMQANEKKIVRFP